MVFLKRGDRFRDLKTGFKLACKQAGLDGVTWHTLRHTFASQLLGTGADRGREGAAWAFNCCRHDALRAHER